jgi:Fe-S-cluster containining protein
MENKALCLEQSDFMSYAACMNSAQPNSLNPFSTLQQNAGELFDQILKRNASKMACQSGCSKCCHAEFSIFMGEALLIHEWFQSLSVSEKEEIRAKWAGNPQKGACAFLRNDQCTIYFARPIICRTQGAPLSFSMEKKAEVTKTIDCCPLNFDAGKAIPKTPGDWFDLDRLTSLQAIAENFTRKKFEIPEALLKLADENERVPLRALQQLLQSLPIN